MKEKRKVVPLNAKLYLGRIAQEKIGHRKFSSEKLGQAKFGRRDIDKGLVLCCDGLCCVLDFSKILDPGDLVTRNRQFKWMLRQEPFGGLIWNAQSDHVFQLNHAAYSVLKELTTGKSVEEVSDKMQVQESDIYRLFSKITKNYSKYKVK